MNKTTSTYSSTVIVEDNQDIWAFQQSLSNRLIRWNLANVAGGVLLSFLSPFWRGVGSQGIGWGFINILIGIVGMRAARRKAAQHDTKSADKQIQEVNNLFRLLVINAGLDVLYMLGGRWLIRKSKAQPYRHGIGWGIVIQGFLLFVFDVTQAALVSPKRPDQFGR